MKSYEISYEISGIGQVYNEEINYDYEHGAISDVEYEMMIENFNTGTLKWSCVKETKDEFCFNYFGEHSVIVKAESETRAVEKAKDMIQKADFGKLSEIKIDFIKSRELDKDSFREKE